MRASSKSSRLRRLGATAALGAIAAALVSLAPGCGAKAEGVEACRKIEEERCRQAPTCPDVFSVHTSDDVVECVMLYRDQCLHGLAVPDPGAPKVDACVKAIAAAGRCAAAGQTLAQCAAAEIGATTATSPCDVLQTPELAPACAFLQPTPETVDAGSDAASFDADAADGE